MTLRVCARRFFCDGASCERKIFCERLPDVAAHARKTLPVGVAGGRGPFAGALAAPIGGSIIVVAACLVALFLPAK